MDHPRPATLGSCQAAAGVPTLALALAIASFEPLETFLPRLSFGLSSVHLILSRTFPSRNGLSATYLLVFGIYPASERFMSPINAIVRLLEPRRGT